MTMAMRLGLLGLAALSTLVLAPAGPAEANKKGTVGEVSFLKGEASRKTKSAGKWTPLKDGAALFEGDAIKTSASTKLEAKLADGSLIRLGANSELSLDKVTFNKTKGVQKFQAKLVVGKVWAAVRSLFGSESSFEVTTENAVAGVRGTRFSAAVGEAGDTWVKVYEGKVLVSNEPIYKVKGATK